MLDFEAHDRAVRQLYAAAVGDLDWGDPLATIADGFGYSAGVLAVFDPLLQTYRACAHGRSDDFANEYYQSAVFRRDPRVAIFAAVPAGRIYHDHGLYDVAAMARDPRVRETTETIGVAHQIGLSLRLPLGAAGMFTLLSTEAEGAAGEAHVVAFRRLAPHVEQACALGQLFERGATTQAALIEALAARADGVMLLDMAGRPSFANDAARVILSAGDGLSWTEDGFVTARGAETRRIRAMVNSAMAAPTAADPTKPGGSILVTRSSGRKPYVVRVLPAPPVERLLARIASACVIHIHDLAAMRMPDPMLVARVFGLTERETDLAVELLRCAGLADAAVAATMSYNTARNHLQSIFRKCGVSRQAELLQLLAHLPH